VGAAGDLPMVFVPGLTPERPPESVELEEVIDYREVERRLEELSLPGDVDVVYLGCPHASSTQVERLAAELSKRTPRPGRPTLLITMSRHEEARLSAEARRTLRQYGALLVRDTCLVVSPVRGGLKVVTDSYKAYFYLSRKGLKVGLEPLEEIVRRLAA